MRAVCFVASIVAYVVCVSGLATALLRVSTRLARGENKALPVGSCILLAASIWLIGMIGICRVLVLPMLLSDRLTNEFSMFVGYLALCTIGGFLVVPFVAPIISGIAWLFVISKEDKSIQPAWPLTAIVVYLFAWFVVSHNTWFLVGD